MVRRSGDETRKAGKWVGIDETLRQAVFFQFLTTPAATHLLARASYLCDYPLSERTAVDELRGYLPSRPDQVFNQE